MNLVAAAAFLMFSVGRWAIPLAAWLSPIFLLRFVRGGRALPRLIAAGVAIYLVGCLVWWGMVPVPAPGYFGIMLLIILPTLIPYAVGRFVRRAADLMSKAGRERADLLVVPSSDWRDIDPVHTRMALMRGVENGCSVVRPTNKGLCAAADYQGRILAVTDFFRTSPCVMVAQVPVRGVRTLYPRAH